METITTNARCYVNRNDPDFYLFDTSIRDLDHEGPAIHIDLTKGLAKDLGHGANVITCREPLDIIVDPSEENCVNSKNRNHPETISTASPPVSPNSFKAAVCKNLECWNALGKRVANLPDLHEALVLNIHPDSDSN